MTANSFVNTDATYILRKQGHMECLRKFINSPQILLLPSTRNAESQLLEIEHMGMLKISTSRRRLWGNFRLKRIQMCLNCALKTLRVSMTAATMTAVCSQGQCTCFKGFALFVFLQSQALQDKHGLSF